MDYYSAMKKKELARCWWLVPVILATQKGEVRRITFEVNPGKSFESPYLEKNLHKRAGGVAQVAGPEFKPQYCKKKKRRRR
jgi:hypothetical protein